MQSEKRYQLGKSPSLTVQRDERGDVYRSYEKELLIINGKQAVYTDYKQYSATTTKHQRLLAAFFPEYYQLPAKREKGTI